VQRDDYVRYAGDGGLYLWDNECQVRWDNLSKSDLTDWLLFFDVCREEPTAFTEAIIAAIMNGLCPHRTTATFIKTLAGKAGKEGRDWVAGTYWYFREDAARGFFGRDRVPEFTRKPAAYYLREWSYYLGVPIPGREIIPITLSHRAWPRDVRKRAWKIHKFNHPFDAWRFLFQFV
jgi:hypothetical protein